MGSNRLKLNAEKNQLIWIGTGQQLTKLTVTQLQLINSVVEFDRQYGHEPPRAWYLTVSCPCLSRLLLSAAHVSTKSSLTREALHSLIHAFVHCGLDYCNSVLAGVAKV